MRYHLRSYRVNPQCIIVGAGALYVPVTLLCFNPLDCESGSRFYTDAMRYHPRSYRVNPQCIIIGAGALYVPVTLKVRVG